MALRLANISIFFMVLGLLLAGVIMLQVYSCKKENKWLGLIMPGIFFCFSLIAILGFAFFTPMVVSHPSIEIIISILSIAFIMNIPTFILLAIYFACRQKQRKNKELEKMNIQDLE